MTYLHQLLPTVSLSVAGLEGAHISFRYVELEQLDPKYVNGWALASGYPIERCTITPFADRDGGSGLVLKIYEATDSALRPDSNPDLRKWNAEAARARGNALYQARWATPSRKALRVRLIAFSMVPLLVVTGAVSLFSHSIMASLVFVLLFGAWIWLFWLASTIASKEKTTAET